MFGNTVGGLFQIIFIIWSGIASFISLCFRAKTADIRQGVWTKIFPRSGASSDFYRYEHVYKDNGTYASEMKCFTKIPPADSNKPDGKSGEEKCTREEFLEAANLKKKDFCMVRKKGPRRISI